MLYLVTDAGTGIHPAVTRHGGIRCIIESILIFISVFANVIGVAFVVVTHSKHKSVYHILYMNVSISNILACLLTWFVGNVSFFFSDWFLRNLQPDSERYCEALLYYNMGLPVALCVAIQMNISMFALTVCQYYAICKPLQSKYILQKNRAIVLIVLSIVVFLFCGSVPFVVSICRVAGWTDCDQVAQLYIEKNLKITVNVYSGIIIFMYILTISLGARIFQAIREYASRTRSLSERNELHMDGKKLARDKRAFTVTMCLLLSRTLFTIPLQIYFVLNINRNGLHDNATVMYLTVLPCAKCILDPFIYGSLMRDVNKTVRNLSEKYTAFRTSASMSVGRNSVFLPSIPASGSRLSDSFDVKPTHVSFQTGTVLRCIEDRNDKAMYM